MFHFLYFILFLLLTSCATRKAENQYEKQNQNQPLVEQKYTLSADRKKLEELRSQIPPETQQQNDELAFVLQLTQEVKKSPSEIRSQFDQVLRKKRENFDKDMRKERETFTQQERKSRDAFLKKQADERKEFLNQKTTKEIRNEFFSNQESNRKEFFANEKEKRADFESDVRERRKNFEDYAREKTNEFNQEHRAYVKKYEEQKKLKQKANNTSTSSQNQSPVRSFLQDVYDPQADQQQLDSELEEAKRRPGQPLGAGD
jgi:hypothetical protein